MKALFIQSFLILSLFSLVGCGSQEKPVSLEVSSSFALGAAGFTGGLIAYGDGPNAKKFSVSADTGKSVTANIVSGSWQIYIVGWEGPGRFEGARHCGMLSKNLGLSDTSVNVNISTAQCSDPTFQANIGIQELYTTSCGGFYKYDPTTDVYSIPGPSEDNYCATQPTTLSYAHSHYKIVALNIQDQGPSQGISSGCIQTGTAPMIVRRFLPTKKIPFIIKTYPTQTECLNSTNPQVASFNFPNGIEAGNSASFGHEFILNGLQARLSLPSFMTRRGRSPFMNMLPRVLCGTSGSFTDCLPDPTNSKHVNVNFRSNSGPSDNRQLLLKGVGNVSTVPSGLFSSLNYFNVSDLQIKNGNLYGSVGKNALTCQASGEHSDMKDIYKRGDLIYTLYNFGSNSWIKVFNLKGKEIRKHYISGEVYNDLVAGTNQNVFVGNATTIKKLTFSSGSYTSSTFLSGSDNFQEMELSADETALAVANGTTGTIVTYYTSNATAVGTARSYTSPLKQMQMYGSTLYFYDSTSGGSLKTAAFGSTLATPSLIQAGLSWESFYYDGANYYAFLLSGSYYIKKYTVSFTSIDSTVTLTSSTATKQMIGLNGNIYLADADSSNLQIFNGAALSTSIDNISGECNESSAVTVGSVSETLLFNAKADDSVYRLFKRGLEIAGMRFISEDPKAFYYFQRLAPEGNEPRTGGQLSHPQDTLGPNGMASFASEFPTCEHLKAAITLSGPITRTRTFFDISENKNQSYTATAQIINEAVNTYFCNDSDPAGDCSSDAFDIKISYQSNNPGEVDRGVLKVHCGSNVGRKLGSLESYESKSGSTRRVMTIWNTTDSTASRFEYYGFDLESEVRGRIEKFAKTNASDFWSRSIHTEESGGQISSSVTEYHRIVPVTATDQEFIMKSFNLQDTSAGFNYNITPDADGFEFDDIAANTEFNSSITSLPVTPKVCLDVNVDSTQAANELIPTSTCFQNAFPVIGSTTMSLDATNLLLDINSMIGISASAPLPLHPIRNIFTIP